MCAWNENILQFREISWQTLTVVETIFLPQENKQLKKRSKNVSLKFSTSSHKKVSHFVWELSPTLVVYVFQMCIFWREHIQNYHLDWGEPARKNFIFGGKTRKIFAKRENFFFFR